MCRLFVLLVVALVAGELSSLSNSSERWGNVERCRECAHFLANETELTIFPCLASIYSCLRLPAEGDPLRGCQIQLCLGCYPRWCQHEAPIVSLDHVKHDDDAFLDFYDHHNVIPDGPFLSLHLTDPSPLFHFHDLVSPPQRWHLQGGRCPLGDLRLGARERLPRPG